MSRRTAEGTLLTWRLTPVTAVPADGLVPFLIDWGSTAHPTSGPMPTLPLSSFAGEHPQPDGVRAILTALDIELAVEPSDQPRLRVTLRCPSGPVVFN
jgi:hypothetical protein